MDDTLALIAPGRQVRLTTDLASGGLHISIRTGFDITNAYLTADEAVTLTLWLDTITGDSR